MTDQERERREKLMEDLRNLLDRLEEDAKKNPKRAKRLRKKMKLLDRFGCPF